MSWDIYDRNRSLEQMKQRIQSAAIAREDKELLLAFEQACVIEGLATARRLKLLHHLLVLSRTYLCKPFSSATKQDLREVISRLEAADYAPYTRRDFKIALRRFYKWLVYRDDALTRTDWPDIVAWIRPTMKRKDLCRVRAADLFTPDEVDRMIEATMSVRNRAFIAMLYEVGGRIGEVGTLRVGDLTRDEYSFLADLDGKTGKRTVRIVMYAAHLVSWLNLHPGRTNPAAPLWPSLRPSSRLGALGYNELAEILKDSGNAAGIRKRLYPHLLRHSRATHLLAAGHLNEAQAKVYFGWTADTRMLATYAHLVSKDANDAILRMYGIEKKQAVPQAARDCGMCRAPNPVSGKFCFHCGYALTFESSEDAKKRTSDAEEILLRLLDQPGIRDALKKVLLNDPRNSDTSSELHGAVAPQREPNEGRALRTKTA